MSEKDTRLDQDLARLSSADIPAPRPEAGARARALALAAFDAAQQDPGRATQESVAGRRFTSISNLAKRMFEMDMRIPVAATVLGVLLVPLALELSRQTALTPLPDLIVAQRSRDAAAPAEPEIVVGAPAPAPRAEEANDMAASGVMRKQAVPMGQVGAPMLAARPATSEGYATPLPGSVMAGDQFAHFTDGGLLRTDANPLSTFSADVDTVSYAYVRRAIESGQLPQADAVRVEEMINYFDYGYAAADSADEPFKPTIAVYPSPWAAGKLILQIGIKGYEPPVAARAPVNLVFLIDTSGSMDAPDKLPLLKRSLGLLLDTLTDKDTVAIVTYAGSAGTVLEPTSAAERGKILSAMDALTPAGSTAGQAGIEEAYRLAALAKQDGDVSRVILATDGDFNVGINNPQELTRFIAKKRESGISLSVLGFGQGNYNDALMQALAQNGNGNAAYIDRLSEAQKVLSEEAGATLFTIASDVKFQVEFNPAAIVEYRQIGYETRALRNEDFNNDRVDAGEVGAGHTVTALYELTPVGSAAQSTDPLRYGETKPQPASGSADELGFVKMRYKLPGQGESRLISVPVAASSAYASYEAAPVPVRLAAAVAGFGQKLRGNDALDTMGYRDFADMVHAANPDDPHGYWAEFRRLADLAAGLAGEGPCTAPAGNRYCR